MREKYTKVLELIKKSADKNDSDLFMQAATLFYDGLVDCLEEWRNGIYPEYGKYEMELYELFQSRVSTHMYAYAETVNSIIQKFERNMAQLQMRSDMGESGSRLKYELEQSNQIKDTLLTEAGKKLLAIFKADYEVLTFIEYLDKELTAKRKICPSILSIFAINKTYIIGHKKYSQYINDASMVKKYDKVFSIFDNILIKCEKQLIEIQNKSYWSTHLSEKKQHEKELVSLKEIMERCKPIYDDYKWKTEVEINNLRKIRDQKIKEEIECDNQQAVVNKLEYELNNCNFFQGKKKKELQNRITLECEKHAELESIAKAKRNEHNVLYNSKINEIKNYKPNEIYEYENALKRKEEILSVLSSNPSPDSQELIEFRKVVKIIKEAKMKQ